jgi:2-polyprenyl-3-methyl-5-hydroxy-6-metoxy-1,4-benzoquinol methylase
VYNALQKLHPTSVLDIGANTGWFSILSAKLGCQVVAVDNDEASMGLLYKRSKRENLSILPLVMDIAQATPDVYPAPNLATDPHMINSRIKDTAPVLINAAKRLKCDMVLALALIHHLALGRGLGLQETAKLLAFFSLNHLVVEFVPKEDPLIVAERDFFPAFNKNPSNFEWYTEDNWVKALGKHYQSIDVKESNSGRKLMICSV